MNQAILPPVIINRVDWAVSLMVIAVGEGKH